MLFAPAFTLASEAVIEDNPEVVLIKYPVSFPSDYLRREICLEVGPLASRHPHADYAAMEFMFYGARPEFADMMAQISDLEREINSL